MKNFCFFFFLFLAINLSAQNSITWVGGTPGKETKWNEPRNWDSNRVPDENTHVIIQKTNTGHFAQPVVSDLVKVAWIEIRQGAELNIKASGQLIVDGADTYSEGISIHGGKIQSSGRIILKNIEEEFIPDCESVALSKQVNYYSTLHDFEFSVVISQ